MEGWISIKRGWFWSQRYGFISPGEFKYYDDQAMTKLKRTFKLKDLQIVQNRADKIIKLVQNNTEQLQIKSDLHELWYTKLIQSKVSSMNINYIPQQQAQELIRRNSQNANIQALEQQNINPNLEVNPLDISNMDINRNQLVQRANNVLNQQQPLQRIQNNQSSQRNQLDLAQGQVQNVQHRFQQQQMPQQHIQQIQQRQVAQQVQQQRIVNAQQNNQQIINQQPQQQQIILQNQQQQQQELQPEKEKGVFSKFKDFILGRKDDFYDQSFVRELNNNADEKMAAKQKIEELIYPITSQANLFNFEQYSNNIQFNFLQNIYLQQVFEEKRNIFPIRIFFTLLLMFIIVFNQIQWQSNQLVYTFCSVLIILFCVFYRHLKSKQIASKCHVEAFTYHPLQIKDQYTVNQLLKKLRDINRNLIIFEQEKNKILFILDRNALFSAVYFLHIESSTKLDIKIYTKNYEYLDSIIENFSASNYIKKIGIWKENQQTIPNQVVLFEIFGQKLRKYSSQYQIYRDNAKEPMNELLYVIIQVIKNNWQFSYELFVLICLLYRMRDQLVIPFNWMIISNWFLIINYGITFTKLTFFFESIFLNLRNEIRIHEKLLDKARNNYYKKDIYQITFNQKEILIQNKISDVEVWFVCSSLFISIVLNDWLKVIQVILLPVLKPTFLQRYDQLKKILITVPSVLVLSVVGILAGFFFGAMYVIWFILKQFSNLISFVFRGCKTRKEQASQNQNQVYIKFFEASAIENYQDQECYICLEGYASAKEKVFRCKNKHFYHKDCILKWITSGNFSATRKCPICRIDLL